ncbi:hypothetical protein K458DRAFT_411989 [Lentithecium fluviatile CBS 122367]|uniref:Uncharacterized protein n=1 Tax=Lentithecium fluviatile CBS 122367 TaxID=1168545 RepID=A0A6G1JJN1_9PLEO|nr:hypothetical protein K458DRAFT_411989 [Lentithecium fluviatile CBS 122367]
MDYEYRGNDKEQDDLEADDSSQGSAPRADQIAETQPTAETPPPQPPAPVESPGALIDPTSYLSLKSPTPARMQETSPSPPPTASSESHRSMLSMEDILNPAASSTTVESETVASKEKGNAASAIGQSWPMSSETQGEAEEAASAGKDAGGGVGMEGILGERRDVGSW